MSVTLDPVWPWSHVWAFLSGAPGVVVAAALLAGLLALVLPILLRLRPYGQGPRQLLRGGGVLLATLLCVVMLNAAGTSAGLAGGARDVGLVLLLFVPLALVGFTVWTYLGMPGTTPRRVGIVLALRLAAFALALLAVLRPSLAFSDRDRQRTLLLIAADASESMSIRDEQNSRSRWELLLHVLKECEPALDRLREDHNVEVRFFRFAADAAAFQPDDPGKPDGLRTDIGRLLHHLYETREGKTPARGLLLLSDGAHNGSLRTPPLAEAARWRALPCPVETFACGNPNTSDRQNDVALTGIAVAPALVPLKGKMTVKLTLDAPGFENSTVRLRLFLDGKEAAARNAALPLTTGNVVTLECNAPTKAGEVKVLVRAEDPRREGRVPSGDLFAANNKIETFATVTKEGISVLLVDRQRAFEPQMICDALEGEPRIRVHKVWLRGSRPLEKGREDLFQFDEKQYDVILLGDVTAAQMRAVNPQALEAIARLVDRGAGLLMMGGYASFGNSDWQGTEIERLLPVDLGVGGQDEREARMVPTDAGLRRFGYLLKLTGAKDSRAAWGRLPPLQGRSVLARSGKGLDVVLAETPGGEPLLIAQDRGDARVLAFGGDTTHRWVRNAEGRELFTRFWRHLVIWLARQEDAEGSVWVKPETRRLPLGGELSFEVGVRSKGGVDLKGGTFKAEVVGPDGVRRPVAVGPAGGEDRGTFTRTELPGEYRIEVHGEAKDEGGEMVRGEASARFIVYDEDLEMKNRAADHDFLKKLATAGGGQFHRIEELPRFLERLPAQLQARTRPKVDLWPNWRTTGRSPFLQWFFLAFVALLAGEWLLRRRWGMV